MLPGRAEVKVVLVQATRDTVFQRSLRVTAPFVWLRVYRAGRLEPQIKKHNRGFVFYWPGSRIVHRG